LQAEGWRTVTPYLRGSGPTIFLSEETPRVGAAVALAQDAVDLAGGLGLEQFAVIGHDWGARVAYALAALCPERIQPWRVWRWRPTAGSVYRPVVRTIEALLASG
jgi:pimeloyl-ACP methyl ester carboxylesterase